MTDATGIDVTRVRTRARVYAYLLDADRAVGVQELSRALDVHHNSIRRHLDALVESGRVEQTTEGHAGPGRPRLAYRAVPESVTLSFDKCPFLGTVVPTADMCDLHLAMVRELTSALGDVTLKQVEMHDPAEGCRLHFERTPR